MKTREAKAKAVRGAFLTVFNVTLPDVVEDIFKGNVPDHMTEHLISKANSFHRTAENNADAWIRFTLYLDGENFEVLVDYFDNMK